jgi:hypothetical protein
MASSSVTWQPLPLMMSRSVATAEGMDRHRIASAVQLARRNRALGRRHKRCAVTPIVAAQEIKLVVDDLEEKGIDGRFIVNRLVRKRGLSEVKESCGGSAPRIACQISE